MMRSAVGVLIHAGGSGSSPAAADRSASERSQRPTLAATELASPAYLPCSHWLRAAALTPACFAAAAWDRPAASIASRALSGVAADCVD